MCVKVCVGRGFVTAYAPLAGKEGESLVDEDAEEKTCGMFVVELKDAVIMCELEHNADPRLTYISMRSNRAQLYHQGRISKK